MIIKVCGMREAENIRAVEQCGIDWMGFIFFDASKRYVADLPEYLPASAQRIGVFVNATLTAICNRIQTFGLQLIQLHGNEPASLCEELRKKGVRIIKAFAVRQADDFKQTEAYASCCDYFLFDTPCAGYGGSGKRFDWELLKSYQGSTPFLLSGGIGPDSLEALSHFSHPRWAGIDLNSGFETRPAYKNAAALKTFVESFKKLSL